MKNKKYLVTGGAGFIGTNLVHMLVQRGNPVTVVDDLSAGDATRLPTEVDFHQLDIRDNKNLTALFGDVDVVVHLAAQPRVQTSIEEPVSVHDVNVNGTLSVLEAARTAKVPKVVFASSCAIYGDQETMPLSVDMKPQPKSPYALHKCTGELMMKTWHEVYGLGTVSLRFFNVYGPHYDPNGPYALVIGRFLNLRSQDKPLTIVGDGEATRDYVHVEDVSTAIIMAAENEQVSSGEVFNVGSSKETSVNELATMIGGPTEPMEPRLEPRRALADISHTTEKLGWKPTKDLKDSIVALKKDLGLV
jgi:nucleoside-diphosphate-sugar epimerase